MFNCEEDTKEGMQKNFSDIYVTRFLPHSCYNRGQVIITFLIVHSDHHTNIVDNMPFAIFFSLIF